jgi:hypothetical protein
MLLLALLVTAVASMPVLQPRVLGCGVAGVDFVAQVCANMFHLLLLLAPVPAYFYLKYIYKQHLRADHSAILTFACVSFS